MDQENSCDHKCIRCCNLADFQCERCDTFYCSPQCQRNDWRNHRRVCLPKLYSSCSSTPKMRRSETTDKNANRMQKESNIPKQADRMEIVNTQKMSIFAKVIPSNSRVFITHVIDHRSMYVRENSNEVEEYLLKLFVDLDRYGESAEPSSELPAHGEIMLATIDNEYYRVVILKVKSKNNKIDVFFMDFGNTGRLWLCQLSRLSDELKLRKPMINKITLKDVNATADGVNDYQLKTVQRIHESEMKLVLKYDEENGSPSESVLHFLFEPITLNEKLNRLNKIGKAENDAHDAFKQLTLSELPVSLYDIEWICVEGKDIEMVVVNNTWQADRQIVCVPVENKNAFEKDMKAIEVYCKSSVSVTSVKSYVPELLEICLVLDLQNQFRRASCVCRKEAEASMVLLDYGNLIFVKFSNIRKLPKCLAFPTFAIKCNVIDAENVECKINQVLKFSKVEISSEKERYCDVTLAK